MNLFSGGAVITNPPLNQNKTEGDLVNFSCEGEVTKSSIIQILENENNFQKKPGNPGKPNNQLVQGQHPDPERQLHAGTKLKCESASYPPSKAFLCFIKKVQLNPRFI